MAQTTGLVAAAAAAAAAGKPAAGKPGPGPAGPGKERMGLAAGLFQVGIQLDGDLWASSACS